MLLLLRAVKKLRDHDRSGSSNKKQQKQTEAL